MRLVARADIVTRHVVKQKLIVEPDPVENNANHAYIGGWPQEKSAQKSISLQLAKSSTVVKPPAP